MSYELNSVIILMELAAGDLRCLLRQMSATSSLNVSSVCSIWDSLVRAVETAHAENIIHRDLKPDNFLLVPASAPFADKILATTSTPAENFRFRLLCDKAGDDSEEAGGDVEVTLTDASSGEEVVLRLSIKLSDFGLSRPLELGASHLSVNGYAGTLEYSAPETLRINEDDRQKLCFRADIWSLGVMLFEMLHNGKTLFERYKKRGRMHLGMAIITPCVYDCVMAFGGGEFWGKERERLEGGTFALSGEGEAAGGEKPTTLGEKMLHSWLQVSMLFRMCKLCLAHDAADRAEAADLVRWMECMNSNRLADVAGGPSLVLRVAGELGGAGGGDVFAEAELERIGNKIGHVLFPELWGAAPQKALVMETAEGAGDEFSMETERNGRHDGRSSRKRTLRGIVALCLALFALVSLVFFCVWRLVSMDGKASADAIDHPAAPDHPTTTTPDHPPTMTAPDHPPDHPPTTTAPEPQTSPASNKEPPTGEELLPPTKYAPVAVAPKRFLGRVEGLLPPTSPMSSASNKESPTGEGRLPPTGDSAVAAADNICCCTNSPKTSPPVSDPVGKVCAFGAVCEVVCSAAFDPATLVTPTALLTHSPPVSSATRPPEGIPVSSAFASGPPSPVSSNQSPTGEQILSYIHDGVAKNNFPRDGGASNRISELHVQLTNGQEEEVRFDKLTKDERDFIWAAVNDGSFQKELGLSITIGSSTVYSV